MGRPFFLSHAFGWRFAVGIYAKKKLKQRGVLLVENTPAHASRGFAHWIGSAMSIWAIRKPEVGLGNVREAVLADALAIAEIHVAAWQETYRGLLPSSLLDSLETSEKLGLWQEVLSLAAEQDDVAVCVARVGGDCVGFASMRPQPDGGLRAAGFGAEVSALYVLKQAQGRGLGRELMRWLAVQVGVAGLHGASLWVLESNKNARGFYEALGGEPVAERLELRGGAEVRAVAYGWRDLSLLV